MFKFDYNTKEMLYKFKNNLEMKLKTIKLNKNNPPDLRAKRRKKSRRKNDWSIRPIQDRAKKSKISTNKGRN